MDAHALVPVKRLEEAKSRLAEVLGPAEREALMRRLLDDVVASIRDAGIERITLVTSEPLELPGVERWDDRGVAWNEALSLAMLEVRTPVVAIVSADLPLLEPGDVLALVEATPERGIAIARATDRGTNAVTMRPPGALVTCFGEPESARGHAEAARRLGLDYAIVDLPGLAFDVDTPADLERLEATPA